MTTPSRFHCFKCSAPFPAELFNAGLTGCPQCGVPTRIDAFPALFVKAGGEAGEDLLLENEACCFFHTRKKAVVPCASCGRFLCALCDVEFAGRHLCPSCIEAGKKKRKMKNMENHRVLHDNIALSLSILPILFFWPTIFTAPVAVYFVIRHWKSPLSILPRTKVRFAFAFIFAFLQIAGWTLLLTRILT
ncbi:MAG TPA: hypothetical protein VFG95_07610 [Nitrospiria bacterium]|nr:hypothetical protein [Nitrospiria bacterium]